MKVEKKNTKKLKSQSINFPEELILAVAVYMQETGAKSISESVCNLVKKGLENTEYMEMLTTTLLDKLEKNREQQIKDTNRIIAIQQITGKNVYALKALSYKAESIKGTLSVIQSEEEFKRTKEAEANLKEFDSRKFEEYFKETRSGGKDNENI